MQTTIKHSKSTLAEGVSVLLWLGLIVIVLGCFQIFFFRSVWTDNLPFALGFLAAEIAIGILGLCYAIAKIRRNETFVCLLDEEIIECVCPARERGDSFKLKVKDIARIEKRPNGNSHRWYLHDHQGNRYWLTADYRNPADKFVRQIRQLQPAVGQIEI
jgi:hypothetical protein